MNELPPAADCDAFQLPGRRESLSLLETRIPGMAEQTRTQMRGIAKVWQPSDFLPQFDDQEKAFEEIRALQRRARTLPPELLVVLAGDTVTEEGLPHFASRLFTIQGLPSGADRDVYTHPGNLQKWFNSWTAEEHRHGVLLNSYLRMSGRIDMGAYERTVQLFLEDGFDVKTGTDPYKGFVYTSFQERATQRSHANVARLAKAAGDPHLARICGQIAADEGYHGKAYSAFVRTFFESDPNGMMVALNDMMQAGIVMPAHNMREVDPSGAVLQPGKTYEYFSNVAQQIGVYTTKDYADISAEILEDWGVGKRGTDGWEVLPFAGLNDQGLEAQAKILKRQRVVDRMSERRGKKTEVQPYDTSWLVRSGGK